MTTNKSGAAGGKKRKWYLYDRMLFIVPLNISDTSTTSNVPPVSSDEDVLDDEDTMSQASTSSFISAQNVDTLTPAPLPTLAIDESCNQDTPSNHPTTSESQPQAQQNPRPRRPKLVPQRRAQATEFEAEMLKAAQRLATKQVESDEDEHFFKNLIHVPKMKLLNIVDKMKCQAEIHMVVLKYVEKASDSAVLQPERVYQTPVHTSTALLHQRNTKYHSSHSPQTTHMQNPIQYEEYQYTTSVNVMFLL
ncbi:hypothetical protein PoB_004546600 [Plakobranchus ocellatus]|uniref:BESS domain-containing protein n=1 Tax=Plakobranchus ocellatus TaxID=259542 RepID=A0AAV4BJ63_9GAST|nr:hypothetical protein PoB_004546600 [Plakobranchus ocellatus]